MKFKLAQKIAFAVSTLVLLYVLEQKPPGLKSLFKSVFYNKIFFNFRA